MACGPAAIFIEHFCMDLSSESAAHLLVKLTSIKDRLIVALYPPCNRDNDVPDPAIAAADLLWTVCTDNPNVMRLLPKMCVDSGHYTFEFGCSPHAMHNLCKDLLKMAEPKSILGKVLVVVKGIRNVHLLTSMFDMLCIQKLNSSYVLILFTTSRWTTSTFALKRLLLVKQVLVAMPHSIDHDDTFRAVSMCADLQSIILDLIFWKDVAALHHLLLPLNACTGYLEGDDATLSVVYTCLLGEAHHFQTIDSDLLLQLRIDRATLIELVHCRFSTIFSPAHALALMTDPLFTDMVVSLKRVHGNRFVELGQGSIMAHCREASKQIDKDDGHLGDKLTEEFAGFMQRRVGKDSYFHVMRFMKPGLIWAQMDKQQYQHLAPVLRLGSFITKLAALRSEQVALFDDESEDENFDDDFRDANIGLGADHVLDEFLYEEVLEEGLVV
ncbi:hypothetical protein BASA61_009074 [Batrachochytrium salamandrivorans]|nr:hypothetical protein BASA61_009074 [Batrachochytrium salamandrivorans]